MGKRYENYNTYNVEELVAYLNLGHEVCDYQCVTCRHFLRVERAIEKDKTVCIEMSCPCYKRKNKRAYKKLKKSSGVLG